jgi:hypothetical protein
MILAEETASKHHAKNKPAVTDKTKTWTLFFRKAGNKMKQVGSPVPATHSNTQDLQDALIKADLQHSSQDPKSMSSKKNNTTDGPKEEEVEPLTAADGGGEAGEFRKKLRRKSMVIKNKSMGSGRRKSYAANMRLEPKLVDGEQDGGAAAGGGSAAVGGGTRSGKSSASHGRMPSFSEKPGDEEEGEEDEE